MWCIAAVNMIWPVQRLSFLSTQQSRSLLPLHLRTEICPVSETLFSRFSNIGRMDKVQKPGNSECYTPSSDPFRIPKQKTECHRYDNHWIEEGCRDLACHPLSRRFLVRCLRNVDRFPAGYTASRNRRQNFSYPPLWGSQILQKEVQITPRNRKSRSYDVKLHEGQSNRVRLITPYRSFIGYSSNLTMLL
jgi:hypothetical protein